MKNIITVDLEDWYQGIELEQCEWSRCEDRVERDADLLLEILDETETQATFFVLGYVAEKFPLLVRKIREQGHEIGTHGYGHQLVYNLSPNQFRSDLKRSLDCLEQTIGDGVRSYRAPYFSITEKSTWAMDILAGNGIERDSSVFPISNYRYGIPDAPRYPYSVETQNGSLLEIPISTVKIFGRNLSFTGGFYLRFFPYCLIKWAVCRINGEGQPAVIYLHPWELDPDQPRLDLPLRIKLTHYHNLMTTKGKLQALLRDFEFAPARDVVSDGLQFHENAYPGKEEVLWEASR